ncbi:MAG: methionine--tRNA ligase [Alphaproteobacteria bacterium]|nr:methionine--tRNA ligase [Alphaproteobacteria bacterium]
MAAEPYYVTTPIYYVNDVPHIGHAYTTLACDALARFMRLDGRRVMFLTGTDEHGQKVEKAADDLGISAQDLADRNSANFRDLAARMGYSNDDFIRTTEPRHIEAVQHLWRVLLERGEIYLGTYAGWYSVRDEAFFAESELIKGADGKLLAPTGTGAEVEWVEEPSYFFRLSAWQDRLLEFYDAHPDFIAPHSRRNEVVSFVSGGLHDLSVSRTSFKWGVPVPNDPGHVMYVWLDALTNYLTAVGYPDTDSETFRTFWPADLHMVGKDILRFHAVYWPAFLLAAGIEPPKRVFAHGWWTNEGEKISKSLGNVIDPLTLVEEYGLDQVRYFLLREVPFGNDGDFSRSAMVQRVNGDLANGIGNLAQRTLTLIHRNCEGRVPDPDKGKIDGPDDIDLRLACGPSLLAKMRQDLEQQRFDIALQEMMAAVAKADVYITANEPWALKKTDPARMATVLYTLAEAIRSIAILAQPIMPDAAARLLDQLSVPEDARSFAHVEDQEIHWSLTPGTPLPKPEGVFPRLEDKAEA